MLRSIFLGEVQGQCLNFANTNLACNIIRFQFDIANTIRDAKLCMRSMYKCNYSLSCLEILVFIYINL